MSSEIQSTIKDEMKLAMKARAKQRLGVIRLIQAEFKRIEVDERIDLDEARRVCLIISTRIIFKGHMFFWIKRVIRPARDRVHRAFVQF